MIVIKPFLRNGPWSTLPLMDGWLEGVVAPLAEADGGGGPARAVFQSRTGRGLIHPCRPRMSVASARRATAGPAGRNVTTWGYAGLCRESSAAIQGLRLGVMMPVRARMLAAVRLFAGSRPDRQAEIAAARAESERLIALPIGELAVEILPAFGPSGMNIRIGSQRGPREVLKWLLPDLPVRYWPPVIGPVIEALGVLEHANLLTRRSWGESGSSTYDVSRLGQSTLTDGTVRQLLGLGLP